MTEQGADSPRQKRGVRRIKLTRPPERLYYSISDVADMIDIKPYVLRFWEKEFPSLKPKKNRAGNRTYQKKDIELLRRIKELLYKEGFTIFGARQKLKDERTTLHKETAETVAAGPLSAEEARHIRNELGELRREVEELITLFA
jgi:DNA-binding transcriptional MerR regulator